MVRFMTGAALACVLTVTPGSMTAAQEKTVMVGGAPMSRSKDIIDNAVNSKDHTTLVAAVKTAGLVDTLKGPGPFTVFAPTNAAFEALPKGTVEALLKPENKATLTKILTYHVVPGKMDATMLALKDERGGMATITIPDVMQSNGVIHVISSVAMPK